MDKELCKRVERQPMKHISIRISSKLSKWLYDMEYSPTAIFREAAKDLGYKED